MQDQEGPPVVAEEDEEGGADGVRTTSADSGPDRD